MGTVRAVRGGMLPTGPASHTMIRKMTEVDEDVSVAEVTNEPGTTSSWHHHGSHTTCVYVVKGSALVEWGPEGRDSVELATGDFYVISPNTIHREGNPGPGEQVLVGFFLGRGQQVVNVDEPEPAEVPMWGRLGV